MWGNGVITRGHQSYRPSQSDHPAPQAKAPHDLSYYSKQREQSPSTFDPTALHSEWAPGRRRSHSWLEHPPMIHCCYCPGLPWFPLRFSTGSSGPAHGRRKCRIAGRLGRLPRGAHVLYAIDLALPMPGATEWQLKACFAVFGRGWQPIGTGWSWGGSFERRGRWEDLVDFIVSGWRLMVGGYWSLVTALGGRCWGGLQWPTLRE